jgi:hypothetical protein
MNARRHKDPTGAITPESALWSLYVGVCAGLRWRQHAASVAPAVRAPAPPPPPRGARALRP